MLNAFIRFFLDQKLFSFILLSACLAWGFSVAPFDWKSDILPRDAVPVDAIPDLGENQQIVFTSWMGRSPQDIEDQITYPLTSTLLGVPGVETIRSSSMFGVSSIYVIFEEGVDFYWSRSRILEKLNSLPSGLLPEGVQPTLGPDATALGQVFWYTLEGRDQSGNTTGEWDLHELRSIQDFNVRYALSSVRGVSEVASIGGHVQEYQIDLDPLAMTSYGITLDQVMQAARSSNLDVGAKTIEINRVEYLVRGLGYIQSIADLEESVVAMKEGTPVRIKDIAVVNLGPAIRRGVLDKGGSEVVGGVVVARYGANPLEVIQEVKKKILEISPGLPQKTLSDGRLSQLTIVPFYDRSQLIAETLSTLEEALTLEILITIIVVILLVMNVRASLMISSMLPLAILLCFVAMKYFSVDANIVALSGIAIAIGTMVDIGVILTENIITHLHGAPPGKSKRDSIYEASVEVAPAILTAVSTTIISFLPVFTMVAAEGKLFKPLAFTKTFALIAAVVLSLSLLPAMAHVIFSIELRKGRWRLFLNLGALVLALVMLFFLPGLALVLLAVGLAGLLDFVQLPWIKRNLQLTQALIFALAVCYFLNLAWLPLGPEKSYLFNFVFTALVVFGALSIFFLFIKYYGSMLSWCLRNKWKFLLIPISLLLFGILSWQGIRKTLSLSKDTVAHNSFLRSLDKVFPGMGKEFMPALNEGSFLLMPTSMPHSGMEENIELLGQLDMAVQSIPEVEEVVGKLGRIESALDPAPISMFENLIRYKPEYATDEFGDRIRFAVGPGGTFKRDPNGDLIPDEDGSFYRNWRPHIKSPDDIWNEIAAIQFPGVTSAPKLQPIETRLVMLQTGMRAPMGIKVRGPDLETIEAFGRQLERILKQVEGVKKEAVFSDRIVGKPYLQIDLDRSALAQYGLSIKAVQHTIETAIGGMPSTTVVDGRERYAVRVRYARELRDSPEEIANVLVATPEGGQIPIGEISTIEFVKGPQAIKSEDTFLQGYVLFDKLDEYAEVDVIESCQKVIANLISDRKLRVPEGVSFKFAGNYENQIRAEKRMKIVMPLALIIIFLILYLQFRSVATSLIIFSSIMVAFAGGFIMLWLYSKGWFLNFSFMGSSMRDLFQVETINLSVAVWVGFIALFGIATDDGVVMATYLKQRFENRQNHSIQAVRDEVIIAGKRRIRPCLMTTATTLLALLPILTSTGRGSDIMIPMAIPAFGGMTIELFTLFVVPVLFSMRQERLLNRVKS